MCVTHGMRLCEVCSVVVRQCNGDGEGCDGLVISITRCTSVCAILYKIPYHPLSICRSTHVIFRFSCKRDTSSFHFISILHLDNGLMVCIVLVFVASQNFSCKQYDCTNTITITIHRHSQTITFIHSC